MSTRKVLFGVPLLLAAIAAGVALSVGTQGQATADTPTAAKAPPAKATSGDNAMGGAVKIYSQKEIIAMMKVRPRQADRERAAAWAKARTKSVPRQNTWNPRGTPDFFGTTPNYANTQLPQLNKSGKVKSGTGIRKFVNGLPGLGPKAANNLGQFLPVAVPDTVTYPGSDYYEIAVREYSEKLHSDLPPTKLRGYVQVNNGTDANGQNTIAPAGIHYLGPTIVAQKDRPVRVKFINQLPTGAAGNLFVPTDTTLMGVNTGPLGGTEYYTQNRAVIHLHGGATPWISDGTPNQWITPAGEITSYPKGISVVNVPDMWYDPNTHQPVAAGTPGATNDPGPGMTTMYFTNQQSARLMFYHDHSLGITRLNVYTGAAAGWLIADKAEQELTGGNLNIPVADRVIKQDVKPNTVPSTQIPLIIQDKTFVPTMKELLAEDPTWDKAAWGQRGSLWFPHVYMPNQNPAVPEGASAMGRWDYGPWFWPPFTAMTYGPVPNPLAGTSPTEGPVNPAVPNPSAVPEAFMDTPLVNGTAYPFLKVKRQAYRFRILNACNDRFLNLQLYYAKSNTITKLKNGQPVLQTSSGEVPMVAAVKNNSYPASWPTDGRDGGVPNPKKQGPTMIQIGTEGGFLAAPAKLPNTPINYVYNRRDIVVLNVSSKTLFLGPAERADVIVDFSKCPKGSKVILYNDAPAPVPGFDPRLDYYTGNPDFTSTGGAPSTIAGYGPNTRTIMQFQVGTGKAAKAFDEAALNAAIPAAFGASQDPIIVPQAAYGKAYNTTFADVYSRIQDNDITFVPIGGTSPLTLPLQFKAIIEDFDPDYGRMNALLGIEIPHTNNVNQTSIIQRYVDPATEVLTDSKIEGAAVLGDGTQIWKITHNGVDTHAIHFHLCNVQLINRVGWDGAVRPPDANELGWKETVRMNPLEDIFIALRPRSMKLPFKIPDSIRPYNPTRPLGSTDMFTNIDRFGNPVTTVNQLANYGWEYVWHCHLLGHEENDMMRPLVFQVSPAMPSGQIATPAAGPQVTLSWINNATTPAATTFTVQRATDAAFTANVVTTSVPVTQTTFVDTAVTPATTYYYRVRAENDKAYSVWTANATATTP